MPGGSRGCLHGWDCGGGSDMRKYRTIYRLESFPELEVDLDETPMGVFLELEGPKRAINAVARALGYSKKDYIAVSYLELYWAECERQGKKPGNMVFKRKNN